MDKESEKLEAIIEKYEKIIAEAEKRLAYLDGFCDALNGK